MTHYYHRGDGTDDRYIGGWGRGETLQAVVEHDSGLGVVFGEGILE